MIRYRKVSTRIWNDEKFASLSDDGKLLFLFLLTHPHMTSLGAMRATLNGLAAELRWDVKRLSKAFGEATERGIARADERACCVYLPNFVKHNQPESPNVIKAWISALDEIPECGLKLVAIQEARSVASSMSEAFVKAFDSLGEAFRKTMPNQEQEPEQEQDKRTPIVPGGDSLVAVVLDEYHRALPHCEKISVKNPKRVKRVKVADRLARDLCQQQGWEYEPEVFWNAYFAKCSEDPWLRGDVANPKNARWKQNLDVLLAEDRFAGIMDRAISSMREAA